MDPLWYPYAQMATMDHPLEVESASGCLLKLSNGTQLIDAIGSWWCVIHGYNHPELNLALTKQLNKMAHVMLGGLSHQPAKDLAKRLVDLSPHDLQHVFFSDSGSVGIEVALKMAIQTFINQNRPEKNQFICLKKAYHGDTIGAMAIGDPHDGMHAKFRHIINDNIFLDAPSQATIGRDINTLETIISGCHDRVAAFILEPILQAAGGFNIIPPKYLERARELCTQYDILLICDEVATGFGRTGPLFAVNHADICPDIMVLGKGLTAGYLGHAATLATTNVYSKFYDTNPDKAFMHGPTFMGNPLACAVALKSIELFEKTDCLTKIQQIESTLRSELLNFKHPHVKDCRVIGATGVIEVHDPRHIAGVQSFAQSRGVWLRPFDNYLYTMPAYVITPTELTTITDTMKAWFTQSGTESQ